jgi:predicted nuclease with TOPRIM domain
MKSDALPTYESQLASMRELLAEYQQREAELLPRAKFGDDCYQDRCENAYVEFSVVKRLEEERDQLAAEVEHLEDQLDQRISELAAKEPE